jgi:hypothetical protein
VEKRHKQAASEWWLITQPDHAVLAGELAARLDYPAIPPLSPEIVRAIAVHDAGWAQFDGQAATAAPATAGVPRSFLDMAPSEFLVAWTDSIHIAERGGAPGGIIVSEHFSRLARNRLASGIDSEEDVQRLQGFLCNESNRQTGLRGNSRELATTLDKLTDVLQFCDLVSLYLCCGAAECAEFPQQFGGNTIRVYREEDAFLFTPPVFGRGATLGVSARRHPEARRLTTIPFLLA